MPKGENPLGRPLGEEQQVLKPMPTNGRGCRPSVRSIYAGTRPVAQHAPEQRRRPVSATGNFANCRLISGELKKRYDEFRQLP